MGVKTLKPAGGTMIRVTQLDECGNPDGCYAVSKCWATFTRAPEYTDRAEFSPINADGTLCYSMPQAPALKWLTVGLMLNAVNPIVWQIMTGAPLDLDDALSPNTVGFRTRRGQIVNSRFALELWLRNEGPCEPGMTPYGYYLIPYIVQAKIADLEVGRDEIHFGIQEALGIGPSGWGVGPFNVRRDAVTGTPEPLLTPLSVTSGDDDLDLAQVVTLGPPLATEVCELLAPVFAVAPAAGAHPLAVVGTIPLGPDGNPILPGVIDWGDLTAQVVVTGGTTSPHSYAAAGTFTATYRPTAVSAPTYTSVPIVVS